ncbi:gamma-butyrobetaine dioxygenase-like isoform X2 [Acanthaster planci]|nr:gamma-butyrobetaine dioxygenase-like isoform X2 [Acanthaster planci]XP_022087373.1 gamma-butyrobetaine dioxygenase-like isoform X2 [Acanthaster planci]XP_022087374.1 gamma-butyrobetaine dioxygenase-like isoform X2 [Acanthaster planci]XP_022087376.1 gamma-butyrobetaine dioxygenase-like isoform X2 [Acanthaster planci]XP_022087377.1 gamma-butyrobetaine dioxygenase-like isoform X2 [Acanthaster planci]XP_022087378.1 gamma-butyrobetaine dioxygenase-like isoform X2 [Acanthaster planci]
MAGRLAGISLARLADTSWRICRPIRVVRASGNRFGSIKPLMRRTSGQDGLSVMLTKSYSSAQSEHAVFAPPISLEDHAGAQNGAKTASDVRLDEESKQLVVSWEGGRSQAFPFVWLRDNCRCPRCFHSKALARLTYAHELSVDITAKSVETSPDSDAVTIRWADGHESQFPFHWLGAYCFVDSQQDQLLDPKFDFWGADIDLQSFDFGELLTNDRALYKWLAELVSRGIAVVKNAPSEVGQLHRLGGRVAFLRPCNYGPTFQVKSKVDPSNAAYTSGPLALHTDLAYYIRQPGIQLLHCIEQAECTGGENLFSDGFKVARDLRKDDPEAFRLLSTVPFEFFDVGTDYYGAFHQHARHPTIELDERGEVVSVTISDHSRDPMLRAPLHQVQPLYRALNKYCNMLLDPQNVFKYKMDTGDIMTFNNRRALHGRSSFQVTKASGRHLEGSYLEWDEVNSRLRVLAAQLKITSDK